MGKSWLLGMGLILTAAFGGAGAANWDRFRGPQGTGVSADTHVPVEFGESKNLLWKVKVPGLGNSSPIIWDNQVFLQTASLDGKERSLLCLDARTGKELWKQAFPGQTAKTHAKNTLASATPATDG